MKKKIYKGKKIGVIGMARSGIAAANLAESQGAKVFVSEIRRYSRCKQDIIQLNKNIRFECGRHGGEILKCDLVIKSPGIPNDIYIVRDIKKEKIPIWSEIEFASRLINPLRTIAITGTNGKTTTTTLVGDIFKNFSSNTVVAGNIGSPLAEKLDIIDKNTNLVLEISSYQLEDIHKFHPNICAILNITSDHIEHHGSMKNYINSKIQIFKNQTKKDYCVLNYDDKTCKSLGSKCPSKVIFFSRKTQLKQGVYIKNDKIIVDLPEIKTQLNADLKIPGFHNIENTLAAVAIASSAKIDNLIIQKTISDFKGVEHRIEFIEEIKGVKYINDSKSTNVDSCLVALKSFNQPIWLILGGQDKGFPYTPLIEQIKEKVKGIFLIGEAASKIKYDLKGTTKFYESKYLNKALENCVKLAKSGDIVLLSPACASFDQFTDYEDRGNQFKNIIKELKKQFSN